MSAASDSRREYHKQASATEKSSTIAGQQFGCRDSPESIITPKGRDLACGDGRLDPGSCSDSGDRYENPTLWFVCMCFFPDLCGDGLFYSLNSIAAQ